MSYIPFNNITEKIHAAVTTSNVPQGLDYDYYVRFSEFNPAVSTTDYDPFLLKDYKNDFIHQLSFFMLDQLIGISILGNNNTTNQSSYFTIRIVFITTPQIQRIQQINPHLSFFHILSSYFYFCLDFLIFAAGTDSIGVIRFGYNKFKLINNAYQLGNIIYKPTNNADLDHVRSLANFNIIGNQPYPYHYCQARNLLQFRYLFFNQLQSYNWQFLSHQPFDSIEFFYDIQKNTYTLHKLEQFIQSFNLAQHNIFYHGAQFNDFNFNSILNMNTITHLPTSFYHDLNIFPLHISPIYTWLQQTIPYIKL